MWAYTTYDELYHHGIKGQKWGQRRFQNEDGSYTEAGKRRYGLNRDINDKSRVNIAKIRLGEARRRLDVAKNNNETNTTRIADLQGRVRSAKRTVREMKKVDKGAARAAKGETITGNSVKAMMAVGASKIGRAMLSATLTSIRDQEMSSGTWSAKKEATAHAIDIIGNISMAALSTGYVAKKAIDNQNIRAYNDAKLFGETSIKRVGSQEYADRVKRSKG